MPDTFADNGLLLFEQELRYVFVVGFFEQDWSNKNNKLFDNVNVGKLYASSADCFRDLFSHFSSSFELQIFHKSRILFHG